MSAPAPFRCILCGDLRPPRTVTRDVKHDARGALRVVACDTCGHVQLFPPDYALDFYEEDGQVAAVVRDYGTPMETLFEHSWIEARRRVERFARHGVPLERAGGPLRALDVGGGYGFFGCMLKQAVPGAEVLVLEPSGGRVATGRAQIAARFGPDAMPEVDVSLVDERFAEDHAGRFDLVTLWHVLEHVPQPERLLSLCARLLRPGSGHLCVEVPNIRDDLMTLSPGYAARHYMSEHISYFSPATLEVLARRAVPGAEVAVHGYQRYGIFNYMHWAHVDAPQGADPDLFPGQDRWWLETAWRATKESTRTSDALFLTIAAPGAP